MSATAHPFPRLFGPGHVGIDDAHQGCYRPNRQSLEQYHEGTESAEGTVDYPHGYSTAVFGTSIRFLLPRTVMPSVREPMGRRVCGAASPPSW